MSIYYFSEKKIKGRDAGNKARNDAEQILKQKGYKALKPYGEGNRVKKILFFLKVLFSTKKSDLIIVQYPLLLGYNFLFPFITKVRRFAIIIHDMPRLREQDYSGKDVEDISNVKYIISHNFKMSEYIKENGIDENKISNLEIFDYLVENNLKKEQLPDDAMFCFAGNLVKSPFIYELPQNVKKMGVNIYGINYDKTKGEGLHYKGSFDSEKIACVLQGKYGILWDGPTIDSCTGNFGEYMKFNNPHKLSLYVAAGIPVIVWDKAAVATFVKEHNIGLTVNSLVDLSEKIKEISSSEYTIMKQNIRKIQKKVTSGDYLAKQLDLITESEGKNEI